MLPGVVGGPWQTSLFGTGAVAEPRRLPDPPHEQLGDGAWLIAASAWLGGADHLFGELHDGVPWRAERRWMYERKVEVPRLVAFYGSGEQLPHPELHTIRAALDEQLRPVGAPPLVTAGLCLYRDGRDSVAWHSDRFADRSADDTVVAIVSLGTPRTLRLRCRADRRSRQYTLGNGDLLVMGGTFQRHWEHAVPKSTRCAGPRLSVQFRSSGST
jgi:alkylated DNA repair dioxygenase AlkB